MSIHGTRIIYNGVQIDNLSTEGVEQEPYYDATTSDQIGIRVSMSLTGILHRWSTPMPTFSLGAYVGDPAGADAGVNIEALRPTLELLNTPLRRFQYFISDLCVWDVAPVSSDQELAKFGTHPDQTAAYRPAFANTPRPKCSVIRVISDTSCYIRMNIEFVYNPCNESSQGILNVISSLRWWCADDIDTNTWLTKRAWSGVLQVKTRDFNVHYLRYLTFPPLPAGWKRAGISFAESEDGLTLKFDIVDQEIIAHAPFPASSWRGNVSVHAPFAGIGLKTIDMSLELTGPKGIKKDDLVFLVLNIMDAKIQWFNFASRGTMFVNSIRLRESIEDNTVAGELSVNLTLDTEEEGSGEDVTEVAGFPGLIELIFGNDMSDPTKTGKPKQGNKTTVTGYDPEEPIYYIPRADTLSYIIHPLIQNPCRSNAEYNVSLPQIQTEGRDQDDAYKADEQQSDSDLGSGIDGNQPAPVTTAPAAGVKIVPESPYMMYRLSSRYIVDKGISAFPVYTKPNDSSPEVIIAKVRQPITRREFRFEATRINRWPLTPTDESWTDDETGITHVCDTFDLTGHSVEASADGRKFRYVVAGVVTYVLSRTPTAKEKLFIGAVPHITGEAEDVNIDDVVYLDTGERRDGGQFRPDGADSGGDGGGQPGLPPPEPPPNSCPAPWSQILLADGSTIAAGDLTPGMLVRTRHEHTLEEGNYAVTRVKIIPDVSRLSIQFGDKSLVVSHDHKFWDAGKWIEARDVTVGQVLSGQEITAISAYDRGSVVSITIEDAHTYIVEGILSHNKLYGSGSSDGGIGSSGV